MSGFVGMMHLGGAPIDSGFLQRLTDFQNFRGPDACEIWMGGHVGFGHTLLKSDESSLERQPFSLDGKTWIVADCRVDAGATLIKELENRGGQNVSGATDAELILRAYRVWGEDCVEHLMGDFGFAIWDGQHRRLFCARDQMGVKPFYYAQIGSLVIFSNTLDCIRQHPAVSDQLNDLAIADFLMFDMSREPGATSFADIHRLPPAHALVCEGGSVSVRRYWSLPVSAPVHYKQPGEYVDHFRELLDVAVADRLRTNRAGVLMSGGLDSPTVAASAQRILRRREAAGGLHAHTQVSGSLTCDEEGRYAQLAAKALNIPIAFQVNDGDAGLRKQINQAESLWPEPVHSPWCDSGIQEVREIGKNSRVALTGYGADPALSCLLTCHFSQLFKQKQFGRALRDAVRYLRAEGRFSRMYVRTRLRRWLSPKNGSSWYPEWLNKDLERRFSLRERWEELNQPPVPARAARPVAYETVTDPSWPVLFEGYDVGMTGIPVEVRHPFFDLRLLNFLLALPALPWCSDKELLREASKGVLPDAVRLRRKSPLKTDPLVALLQRPESAWVDTFQAAPELERYVQRKLIPKVFRETNGRKVWVHLRPLSLDMWLQHSNASGINRLSVLGAAS